MRIVLFSTSDKNQHLFEQVICERLNRQSYSNWPDFCGHLDSLSVPCQILLDLDHGHFDSHEALLDFIDRYSFHHIICLTQKPSFNLAMTLVGHGSILAQWPDLWNLNWWWNRSLIHFHRTDCENISQKSIILSPYSFNAKVNDFLYHSLWKAVLNTQPLMIRFDGRASFSRIHLELENFRDIVFKHQSSVSYPIVAQFDFISDISPYGFKEFLKNFTEFFKEAQNIRLFLLSDDSQYAFDKILIPCFENEDYDLYKMSLQHLEELLSKSKKPQDLNQELEQAPQKIIFEQIRLEDRSYHP